MPGLSYTQNCGCSVKNRQKNITKQRNQDLRFSGGHWFDFASRIRIVRRFSAADGVGNPIGLEFARLHFKEEACMSAA